METRTYSDAVERPLKEKWWWYGRQTFSTCGHTLPRFLFLEWTHASTLFDFVNFDFFTLFLHLTF